MAFHIRVRPGLLLWRRSCSGCKLQKVTLSTVSQKRGVVDDTSTKKPSAEPYVFRRPRSLADQKHSVSGLEKDNIFSANLGPLSLDDLEVRKRLRIPGSNPSKILRQSIAAGAASVHVVCLCLEAQFLEIYQVSRRERKIIARSQDRIASIALDYLLKDDNLWGPFVMHCTRAQFQLSYYAIIERIQTRIFDWMFKSVSEEQAHTDAWRGSVLRNLIDAHFAFDTESNCDNGILCFFAAQTRLQTILAEAEGNTAATKSQRIQISPLPTMVLFSKALTKGYSDNTNLRLFDQLINFFETQKYFKTTQAETDYDVAHLSLYRPGYPKDKFAMELLRSFAAGKVDAFPERIMTVKGQAYFKKFLQRTMDVLSANGNTADREWVKHTFQVLVDPTTGNFATPTVVHKPGEIAAGKPKRGGRISDLSTERVPFPTFT